jgi:hypothetical protein
LGFLRELLDLTDPGHGMVGLMSKQEIQEPPPLGARERLKDQEEEIRPLRPARCRRTPPKLELVWPRELLGHSLAARVTGHGEDERAHAAPRLHAEPAMRSPRTSALRESAEKSAMSASVSLRSFPAS